MTPISSHRSVSGAAGGRGYRVGVLRAPNRPNHVQDRRRRRTGRRGRRPVRDPDRIAPVPLLSSSREAGRRRAIIIALESSYPFSADEARLLKRSCRFSLLNFDLRGFPHHGGARSHLPGPLLPVAPARGCVPDSKTVTVIALRHTDAKWAADLSDVPASCRRVGRRSRPPRTWMTASRDPDTPRAGLGV